MDEQNVAGASQDLTPEEEARKMGWKPQEEFEGNPDRWVSAEEFIERGKHILPILTKNNDRLKSELSVRDQRIASLSNSLKEAQNAIENLKQYQSEATKRAVEQAKKDIVARLKVAREEGDIDAEVQLSEQLGELRNTEKAASSATEEDNSNKQVAQPTPELMEWKQENTWFEQDQERTARFLRIAAALRASGNQSVGRAFVDEVSKAEKELDAISGNNVNKKPASKVDSSSIGSRPSGSVKSFNSLPEDAKKACLDYANKLVGPNKAYKNLEEWKTAYTKDYFNEN